MGVPQKKKIFTWEVIFSTIMLCSSGTFSIMSLKIQGTTYTFKHSMLQTFLMFLGEYLNLLYFAIPLMASSLQREAHFDQLKKTAIAKNRKLKYTKLWAALPCLLDAVGSGMSITSLLLLPASVCQMLQGGQIVTVCLFSKWINDRPILRHHGAGVGLSSIGFLFVGLAGYIAAKGEQNSKYTVGGFIMGIIFIIINLIFQAVQSNVEERIMTKFAVPVTRMVGLEGLFGIIWMFGVLVILSFIPCPNSQLCDIGGYTEDITTGLKSLFAQPGLIVWCCVTIFAIFFVNQFGMKLIQLVSAVYRTFWSNTTTIIVWACCLIIGYEDFVPLPFFIQLVGFTFLVLGNFTYNEVIRIKFMGLDRDLENTEELAAEPNPSIKTEE
jgi:hypothetical protein